MEGMERQEEKNIYELFSSNTFLKIKPAFDIDKILFAFVKTDNNGKASTSIDCYMSIICAREFAAKIISGRVGNAMAQSAKTQKEQNKQYADTAWESKLGGYTKDGRTISRRFNISPGSRKFGVLQAIQQPGIKEPNGLIKPDNSDSSKIERILVPFENHDELEAMALAIRDACTAYSVRTFK